MILFKSVAGAAALIVWVPTVLLWVPFAFLFQVLQILNLALDSKPLTWRFMGTMATEDVNA